MVQVLIQGDQHQRHLGLDEAGVGLIGLPFQVLLDVREQENQLLRVIGDIETIPEVRDNGLQ